MPAAAALPIVSPKARHDAVSSVASVGNDFLSAADGSVGRWSYDGEWVGSFDTGQEYGVVDMHASGEVIACACSDGCLRLLSVATGKEEKRVVASASGAAITSVRWAFDGSALATAGEDGAVKVWSRSGMLRTTLAGLSRCAYAVRWGADSNTLLYAAGADLSVASLHSESSGATPKPHTWKAHDGVVLACDWSGVSGRIVSGGEDGRYKVWDGGGRLLYASAPADQPITAVAWSPRGTEFAVGSFRSLRLCAAGGWTCARGEGVTSGSSTVTGVAWAGEGTALAAGLGDGRVVFATPLCRSDTAGGVSVLHTGPARLVIRDCAPAPLPGGGALPPPDSFTVDFRDRVVDFSVGSGHVLACTPSQVHILSRGGGWGRSVPVDLPLPPALLLPASKSFLVVDGGGGAHVYGYDGRSTGSFKLPAFRPDLTPVSMASLSPDVLVYVERGAEDRGEEEGDTRAHTPPTSESSSRASSPPRPPPPPLLHSSSDGGRAVWSGARECPLHPPLPHRERWPVAGLPRRARGAHPRAHGCKQRAVHPSPAAQCPHWAGAPPPALLLLGGQSARPRL